MKKQAAFRTNQKVGGATVLRPANHQRTTSRDNWLVKCRCGATFTRTGDALKRRERPPLCRECMQAATDPERRLYPEERQFLEAALRSWRSEDKLRARREMAECILLDRTGYRRLKCHGGTEDF